jgi:putative oxidoreductase
MKIVAMIARLLLGAIFVFFGLNVYLQFLHPPPMPPGAMADFATVLMVTHYMHVVAIFQVVPGLLLLFNRYVPLALTLLAPVIFNILLTHTLMQPAGLPPGLVAVILWFLVFWSVRSAFAGLFQRKVEA